MYKKASSRGLTHESRIVFEILKIISEIKNPRIEDYHTSVSAYVPRPIMLKIRPLVQRIFTCSNNLNTYKEVCLHQGIKLGIGRLLFLVSN